jgi:hypothetical protein
LFGLLGFSPRTLGLKFGNACRLLLAKALQFGTL